MPDAYYDPTFAASYDDNNPGLEGDLEFYASLAREAAAKGQEMLELAAGNGRITIPIAREGVRITGLERAPAMLAIGRERGAGIETLSWVEADMSDFHLGKRFGLIMIPYRSFLHLMTAEEQKACLACVREHLQPDGRLALNFFNPDITMIAEWLNARSGGLERLEPTRDLRSGRRVEWWQTNRYETSEQRLEHTRVGEELSDAGAVVSRFYVDMPMRYIHRYEFEYLLELGGFKVDALYGWFDKTPFGPGSTEMVWVASRRVVGAGGG
jgi:SAM-dependent methyltransferase